MQTNQRAPTAITAEASLDTQQAAKFLNVSTHVLIQWRHRRCGPTYVKYAQNMVRYEIDDLIAFRERHKIPSAESSGL